MTDADRQLQREITPPEIYLNRRAFMKAGILVATAAATGFVYKRINGLPAATTETPPIADLPPTTGPTTGPAAVASGHAGFFVDEPKTSYANITHYNNFYEFSLDKQEVAEVSRDFQTKGWKIEVGGLCARPTTFDLDSLRRISPPEERVYRMRCVEAWSMVIPWDGFSLSKLLAHVEPQSNAKYVAFQTLMDPIRLPNQRSAILNWPYVEGLRIDEAIHPLTMLATGLYGRQLPAQDGAPVRLVVPWKYGFKGIKSIVKITLTETQPPCTWNLAAPNEYGFYANVNPKVDHPRWSQATERRIGGDQNRPTLLFNGYGEQVAGLYRGMDLRANF